MKISLKINGKKIKAKQDQTILDAAMENEIEIPTLCYHPDLSVKANCRLCLVSVKGCLLPQTACSTKVTAGMEIITESPELEKLRKINLELIFSQHKEECDDCVWQSNCQLLELSRKYKVPIDHFNDRKNNFPVYNLEPLINETEIKKRPVLIFDSSKCVDCQNCVEACQKQQVNHLRIISNNNLQEIVPNEENPCVFCGQCLIHCPAGAFESESEFEKITEPLKDKNKVIVFQFAPAVRTSIGEEFGLPYGIDLTKQISAGLKKLGAYAVFDTSCGADFTTIEETTESLERIEKKESLPLFSSCCPAWVRFVEVYYPELIPHFTTVRSPHIILGGLIKTYWAQKEKINPDDIIVVSVMPCTAKKYEIARKELCVNGLAPVDYVLTTRELARLFKKTNIDLKKIEPRDLDNPLGVYSGAGVIYGSSGGVMESALRTAYSISSKGKIKIEFKPVRGQEGLKTAEFNLCQKKIKVAVANGLNNAVRILEGLNHDFKDYACVEVMACPGGCIGGGGQPLPTNDKIRKARAEGLYKIDEKKEVRLAHENPVLKEAYRTFLNNEKIRRQICHTRYLPRNRDI